MSIKERIQKANEEQLYRMLQEPQNPDILPESWLGRVRGPLKKRDLIGSQLRRLATLRSNPDVKRLAQFSQSRQLREVRVENEKILTRMNRILQTKQQSQERKTELTSLVGELQNNYSNTERQLRQSENIINQLKAENANLNATLSRVQQQQIGRKTDMTSMEENLDSLQRQVAMCENELRSSKQENEALYTRLMKQQQTKERPQQSSPRLRAQITELTSSVNGLQMELNTVLDENKNHKKQLKKYETELARAIEELEVARSEYQDNESSFIQSQRTKSNIEKQRGQIRERLEEERKNHAEQIEQFKDMARDMAEQFQSRIQELELALSRR